MSQTTELFKIFGRTVLGLEVLQRSSIDEGRMHLVPRGELGQEIERWQLKRFWDHFKIDCIFDVGANLGQYAMMARSLGFAGPIISFEPNTAIADKLRQAAAVDDLWFVEEVALDETEQDTSFNVMTGHQFSSLHQPQDSEQRFTAHMDVVETLSVRTMRLDTMFDRYRDQLGFARPFLKMDTQGHDVSVAKGGGDRLALFHGLQSELAFKTIYAGQVSYRDALDYYSAQGFTLSSLVPNNHGHFPDLIEMDCIMYNAALVQGGR
jgi:FkbM family methyltransferase